MEGKKIKVLGGICLLWLGGTISYLFGYKGV